MENDLLRMCICWTKFGMRHWIESITPSPNGRHAPIDFKLIGYVDIVL